MARSTMPPAWRRCSRRRGSSRPSRCGRSGPSCSSPTPARSAACSARTIMPTIRPCRRTASSAWSTSTCRCLLYPFTDVTAFGADHSTIGATVAEAGRSMGIAVAPDPMPEEAIFTRSDHYQFVRQGRPGGAADDRPCQWRRGVWANYLGKIYHSPQDDLHARRSIGIRARATRCSITASPGRWPMRRSGRCGSRATISATCSIRRGPALRRPRPPDLDLAALPTIGEPPVYQPSDNSRTRRQASRP